MQRHLGQTSSYESSLRHQKNLGFLNVAKDTINEKKKQEQQGGDNVLQVARLDPVFTFIACTLQRAP